MNLIRCKIFLSVALFFALIDLCAQGTSTLVVSANFGLDNTLPFTINVICFGGANMDGMPVNFKYNIDEASLDASDFEVIDSLGNRHAPLCATLRPAGEKGENRTVLLVGEFGNDGTNPPVEVRIVDDLYTLGMDREQSACSEVLNLKGEFTRNVSSLGKGPGMFLAQKLEGESQECGAGVAQTIQVAWGGGVTPFDNTLDESELFRYYTAYSDSSGILIPHTPISIADINDNDNYHQLCLSTSDSIVKIRIGENVVEDPNGDPNPSSEVNVSYCLDKTTSLLEVNYPVKKIRIFPNPADNYFQIDTETLKGLILIQVKMTSGVTVLEQQLDASQLSSTNFACASLPSGVYLVHCFNKEKSVTGKLIVR